jgi:putative redox protein
VSRNVTVDAGTLRFLQSISIGPHSIHADEPVAAGGNDAGANPYELLLAALGSCASITVQMYAERKQWPLEGVHVELSWGQVHAEDCADCVQSLGLVDGIEMEISFRGNLSEVQRQRMIEIANKCSVHRTLSSQIPIRTRAAAVKV